MHDDERIAYEPPTLVELGTVEELTGELTRGHPDLLSHGDIL